MDLKETVIFKEKTSICWRKENSVNLALFEAIKDHFERLIKEHIFTPLSSVLESLGIPVYKYEYYKIGWKVDDTFEFDWTKVNEDVYELYFGGMSEI